MGWHLLETLLQQVGEHSTLVGKLWVTATFVFRFVIVASVGDAVYSDEQSDFTCNTGQPGCENVCFNLFSPISHLRFWAAQIIAVCTPSIVFIVYAAHMLLKVPEDSLDPYVDEGMDTLEEEEEEVPPPISQPGSPRKRKAPGRMHSGRSRRAAPARRPHSEIGLTRGFANPPDKTTDIIEEIREEENEDEAAENESESDENNDDDDQNKSLSEINRELALMDKMENEDKEKVIKKRIQFFYVVTVLLRTSFEAVFIWLQIILYGFSVPELFQCERKPCPNIVDCYVSRPREKTMFLWFMFAVSCLCLLLNIVEIHYLGFKKLIKVLCGGGGLQKNNDDDVFLDSKEEVVSRSHSDENKGSKSYLKIDKEVYPSSPPEGDAIGFNAIGNHPPYATPGYPYVHRYGMYLNATPPPPVPEEPEKYYL